MSKNRGVYIILSDCVISSVARTMFQRISSATVLQKENNKSENRFNSIQAGKQASTNKLRSTKPIKDYGQFRIFWNSSGTGGLIWNRNQDVGVSSLDPIPKSMNRACKSGDIVLIDCESFASLVVNCSVTLLFSAGAPIVSRGDFTVEERSIFWTKSLAIGLRVKFSFIRSAHFTMKFTSFVCFLCFSP